MKSKSKKRSSAVTFSDGQKVTARILANGSYRDPITRTPSSNLTITCEGKVGVGTCAKFPQRHGMNLECGLNNFSNMKYEIKENGGDFRRYLNGVDDGRATPSEVQFWQQCEAAKADLDRCERFLAEHGMTIETLRTFDRVVAAYPKGLLPALR